MSVAPNIRFGLVARLCTNATGAELKSVSTEAGLFAIRARRRICEEGDYLKAVEKVRSSVHALFDYNWPLKRTLGLLQVINQGKKFSSTSLYSTYSEFRGPSAFQANGFLTARLLNRLNQDLTGGP
jgi:hypothetical protein